jgi:predicted cobalt transporter CbtA
MPGKWLCAAALVLLVAAAPAFAQREPAKREDAKHQADPPWEPPAGWKVVTVKVDRGYVQAVFMPEVDVLAEVRQGGESWMKGVAWNARVMGVQADGESLIVTLAVHPEEVGSLSDAACRGPLCLLAPRPKKGKIQPGGFPPLLETLK